MRAVTIYIIGLILGQITMGLLFLGVYLLIQVLKMIQNAKRT